MADLITTLKPLAIFHRDRHRRWLLRRRRVDRRLRAAPFARDNDHGHVHRRAAGGFGRPDRCGAAGHYDWPVIFIVGGVFPLILALALALWLPESPRFLARKQNLSPSQAALLHRLDIAPSQDHAVDISTGKSGQAAVQRGLCPLQTCSCGSSTSAV
jgi:hypothetical protein